MCICVYTYIKIYKYLLLDRYNREKYARINTETYFSTKQHLHKLNTYACLIMKILSESIIQLLELGKQSGKVFGHSIKIQTWKGSHTPTKISWKKMLIISFSLAVKICRVCVCV